jgi:hypothetical protein
LTQALSVDPALLQANPWNSNVVGAENEAKLDAAIKRMGLFKPIIVREIAGSDHYEILGGEHRWQSAIRLKFDKVPIFNLGLIDDIRAKEVSVADNARYGADDTILFAQLLSEIGSSEDIQEFLPYSQTDVSAIFSSIDIALDELDFDETLAEAEAAPEAKTPKAPKTHTMMRFKISIGDAERITELIEKTKKSQGLTAADDLTNAGDALTYLLLTKPSLA